MFKTRAQVFLPHLLWCIGFTLVTLDQVANFKVSGFTVKSYYFFFAAAGIWYSIQRIRESSTITLLSEVWNVIGKTPFVFFALLLIYFTAMAPFSILPKKSIGYSLLGWFQIFVTLGCGFFIWSAARSKADPWRTWLWCIALSVIVLSLITITDYFAFFYGYPDGLIGFNQDSNTKIHVSRPHAFSYEPSYLAFYLSQCSAFLFTDFLLKARSERSVPMILSGVSIALAAAAIFLCSSRSGWIIFVFFMGTLSFWHYRKEKAVPKSFRNFTISILAVIAFLFVISPKSQLEGLKQRFITPFITMEDGPTNARFKSMLYGVEMGVDTDYLGTGLGASYTYWIKKWDPGYKEFGFPKLDQGAEAVMSLWAQVFAEGGIPGLLLFFAFAASMVRMLFRRLRKNPDPWTRTAFLTGSFFFFFMSHGLGNHMRTDIWVWYVLWLVIATDDTHREALGRS